MSIPLDEVIEQAQRLYDLRVGEGDLTTESLSPYARHTEATIRTLEEISWFPFPILSAIMTHGDDTVTVQEDEQSGSLFSPGETVASVAGNGKAIVTAWGVAVPLLSLMSSIHDKVARCSQVLKPAGIETRHNFDLPVGYDKIIRFAVEAGGGVSFGVGLDEIVYISSDHIRWVGTLFDAMTHTLNEVGDKRFLIKVVLEISDPEEITDLGEMKADLVYCRQFDVSAVGKVKELTRGWVRLMVDETIPLDDVVNLRDAGVRAYMVDLNQFLTAKRRFDITFDS